MTGPAVRRWQDMTPAEVLDSFPALTIGQVAYVLSLYKRNGDLDRDRVRKLVTDGRLALIDDDPSITWPRRTVYADDVRSYLTHNTLGGAA